MSTDLTSKHKPIGIREVAAAAPFLSPTSKNRSGKTTRDKGSVETKPIADLSRLDHDT